jgi:hypothetical protein
VSWRSTKAAKALKLNRDGYPTILLNQADTAPAPPPSETQATAMRRVEEWWDRDKRAKQPFVDEMVEMHKLYTGAHWDLLGENGNPIRRTQEKQSRPNTVENIAWQLIHGLAAEFAQPKELVDTPQEPGDDGPALMLTELKKHIAYKNRLEDQDMLWNLWFSLYGTGIWDTHWDETWRGGRGPNRWRGEIRWVALHPLMLYPDARAKSNINEGYRCHKRFWCPIEHIRETFPETGVHVQVGSVDPADLLDLASASDSDSSDGGGERLEGQASLVETWYKGLPLLPEAGKDAENEPGLHIIWWTSDPVPCYLGHANYVYFKPGETVQFPFHVKQRYFREGTPWGYGDGHYLKNPQIMHNKTAETAMDGHIHQALGQTFYGQNALNEQQQKFVEKNGGMGGLWIQVTDHTRINRVYGMGVPSSLMTDLARRPKAMEAAIGRFDISQGRTPGNVTAFQALSLLAQRAMVRLRTFEAAIKSAYEESGTYINRLIPQFYTEQRSFRLVSRETDGEPAFSRYQPDDLKRVWLLNEPVTTVIPFRDFQPKEGLVEGADYEVYSPEFDTTCRMSSPLPSDRMFYMEMAKELLAAKILPGGENTFWYVLEHGKFPPLKLMRQQQAEQMQAPQQQAPLPDAAMPTAATPQAPAPPLASSPQDMLSEVVGNLAPEELAALEAMPPEELQAVLAQFLQSATGGGMPPAMAR